MSLDVFLGGMGPPSIVHNWVHIKEMSCMFKSVFKRKNSLKTWELSHLPTVRTYLPIYHSRTHKSQTESCPQSHHTWGGRGGVGGGGGMGSLKFSGK
jgi:hypothetical protein